MTGDVHRGRAPARAARRRDRVDGVLLLDKPRGLSSNAAMLEARRLLEADKAGHGGTLDPLADGLLPVLLGEATKFAHDLLEADKTYVATLRLGEITEGGDAEGPVIETRPVTCSAAQVHEACAAFVGEIAQVPPMQSALKRDGRPLYLLARAGIEVERAPRRVRIEAIEPVAIALPDVTVRIACSKGTYVRTLAMDIGARLGCGAHLVALRRERVGALDVARAISLDALRALPDAAARRARLEPVDTLLAGRPRIDLDAVHAARFSHGQRLRIAAAACADRADPVDGPADALCGPATDACPDVRSLRVYGQGRLLGVASLEDGVLVPLRLVAAASPPDLCARCDERDGRVNGNSTP